MSIRARLMMGLALLFGILSPARADDPAGEIEKLRKEVQQVRELLTKTERELRAENHILREIVGEQVMMIDRLEQQLRASRAAWATVGKMVSDLTYENAVMKITAGVLERELARLKTMVDR